MVIERSKASQHGRSAIGLEKHSVDEVRTGKDQVVLRNGRSGVGKEIVGVSTEQLSEILASMLPTLHDAVVKLAWHVSTH